MQVKNNEKVGPRDMNSNCEYGTKRSQGDTVMRSPANAIRLGIVALCTASRGKSRNENMHAIARIDSHDEHLRHTAIPRTHSHRLETAVGLRT